MRCLPVVTLACSIAVLQGQESYQRPSAEILKVLDAPLPPSLNVAPDGRHGLLVVMRRYPSVMDL